MAANQSFLDVFLAQIAQIEQRNVDGNHNWPDELIRELALEGAKLEISKAKEARKAPMQASVANFNKFNGDGPVDNFIQTFLAECDLFGIHVEAQRMLLLPSLLVGSSVQQAQKDVRTQNSLDEMFDVLKASFKCDRNVLIAELRSMRMFDNDIEAYIAKFNKVLNKYPNGSSDAEYIKNLFLDGLSSNFKLRERLLLDRQTVNWTIIELQQEALRQVKTSAALEKKDWKKDKADGEAKTNSKGKNNKDAGQNVNTAETLFQLHNKVHIIEGQSVSFTEGDVKAFDEELSKGVTSFLTLFHQQTALESREVAKYQQLKEALASHLDRVDGGTQTAGRKLSSRDLQTEVERLLLKAQSGLSLYDRIQQDPTLRRELYDLVVGFEQVWQKRQQGILAKAPEPTRQVETGVGPSELRDVEVIMSKAATTYPSNVQRQGAVIADVMDLYNTEELAKLQDYYGVHPRLLDGFVYLKNAETKHFLEHVTGGNRDLCKLFPVMANIPIISILLNGEVKVRAMLDSGSTTTVISQGLLDKLPALKRRVKATSLTYKGIDGEKGQLNYYNGIVEDVQIQLGDRLVTKLDVAISNNDECNIILGNDLIGGSHSKYTVLNYNTDYCFVTLLDKASRVIENLHFVKNIHITSLPKVNLLQTEPGKQMEVRLATLFR